MPDFAYQPLFELELFRRVLGPGVEVVREDHILTGARRCSYRVRKNAG